MSCMRHSFARTLINTSSLQQSFPRSFSSSRNNMVRAGLFEVSQGEKVDDVVQKATELIDRGKWELCNDGKGLERSFKFKTFKATWDFMNTVAAQCKQAKHHPEWSNVYNRTQIRWTTHNPEGLSSKDTTMAKFCDEAAKEHGELEGEAIAQAPDCHTANK